MSQTGNHRPTISTINLDDLAFNFRSVRQFVGEDVRYLAVVKADAYGHGAVQCSKRLEAEGIDWFGVALPEEAVELRDSGIRKPILCMGGFWPGQEELLLRYRITPAISSIEQAEMLNRFAANRGVTADIHIKIDTGMGRIGVRVDEAGDCADKLCKLNNLRVEAMMSHLAAADNLSENEFTDEQISAFSRAVETFRDKGIRPDFVDLANSPGAVAHAASRKDMVRLGGVLYGLGGDVLPKGIPTPELRPILSLQTEVSHIKRVPAGESLGYGRSFYTKHDSVIATLPIGYADGYPRKLSNTGRTIVSGVYAPIVGRISMDWTIIDVTGIPDVEIGSEAILIGRSDNCVILAEDLAALTETISYEITCGVKRRVERRFVGD